MTFCQSSKLPRITARSCIHCWCTLWCTTITLHVKLSGSCTNTLCGNIRHGTSYCHKTFPMDNSNLINYTLHCYHTVQCTVYFDVNWLRAVESRSLKVGKSLKISGANSALHIASCTYWPSTTQTALQSNFAFTSNQMPTILPPRSITNVTTP